MNYVIKYLFSLLVLLILCSCSDSPSAEKVTQAFFQAVKDNDIERAASYMTFVEFEQVGIDRNKFIQWYQENSSVKGYKINKFKVLVVDKFKSHTYVYVISNEEWNNKNAENVIYICKLIKEKGTLKIVEPAPNSGDVPLALKDYFRTPEELAQYQF